MEANLEMRRAGGDVDAANEEIVEPGKCFKSDGTMEGPALLDRMPKEISRKTDEILVSGEA